MFELDNISKRVGNGWHIQDVSMRLERGSVNVLLGPTLAGKTTLMRLMAGLDQPTDGDIRWDGKSLAGVSVRQRDVAMVYQQFINYPGMTVYDNIASPMRIAGADKATIDRKVREAAELLKLENFLDRTPLNLSGGQQQRTAIARALVKGAELVLLDEPLANLDYKLREELRVELPRLFAETGAIFVYATTEPHEALLLGGATATLHEGRVTQFDRTIDVYQQPGNLITAQTFADPPLNLLPVTVNGKQIRFDELGLGSASVDDGQYTLALRPHHVVLQQSGTHGIGIQATVGTTEITGSETFVHMRVAGHSWVALTHGVHSMPAGAPVTVFVDPATFYLFDNEGKLAQAPAAADKAA